MDFTERQNKMLDSKSDRLLVSASAGSGKTSTLIEKVSRLLEDNISLDNMLIVTFTEASSIEMKTRLSAKLKDRVKDNIKLKEQIDLLPTADISTLHSFCYKNIKKYFFKLGLKASFGILDEDRASYYKSKAMEKTLRDYSVACDEEFENLTNIFGGRDFERLKTTLFSLHSFLQSVMNVDEFLNKTLEDAYNLNLDENTACQYLNLYTIGIMNIIRHKLEDMLLKAEQYKAQYFVDILQKALNTLYGVDKDASFTQNRQGVLYSSIDVIYKRKFELQDDLFRTEEKENYDYARKMLVNLKKLLSEKSEKELIEDIKVARDSVTKLFEVYKTFEKEYTAIKDRYNGLDFSDLERYMLLLLHDSEVADSIDKRYIFLDEYQDINNLQEVIISSIAKPDTKIVMVGDVKQSIYAFRNSSPDIIKSKTKLYTIDSSSGELIYLNDNFRSNPTILSFVNSVFLSVMDIDFGGVDYKKSALTSLEQYPQSLDPIVEVNIIDKGQDEDVEYEYDSVYSVLSDKNDYKENMSGDRCEALFIAKKILSLTDGSHCIYDAKTKGTRAITFSDIAILCRNNVILSTLSQVLSTYHVPIQSTVSTKVYDSLEIRELLSLLKIVNGDNDDIALITVLTSQLFGFSFDELVQIREANTEDSFYSAFKNFTIEGKLLSRISEFINYIDYLRDSLCHMSLHELLTYVTYKSGYLDYISSLPMGSDREKKVKEYIDSFKGKDYDYDLTAYLEYVEEYAEDRDNKMNFASGDNCVHLATIHASKGLEYPVVFLMGCAKNFNEKSTDVVYDGDIGVGIDTVLLDSFTKTSNIVKDALLTKKRYKEREEELRLLYVALTRAKNYLYIVASCDAQKLSIKQNKYEYRACTTYIDWIMSSLTSIGIATLKQRGTYAKRLNGGEVRYNLFSKDSFALTSANIQNLDYLCSKIKDEKLDEMLSFDYNTSPSIALKNSVSSLLHSSADYIESRNIEPKNLTIYEGANIDNKSSRLGTAYHKIMQNIDFESDFDRQIFETIKNNAHIDDDLIDDICFEKIFKAYEQIRKLGGKRYRKELPFISYLKYSDIFDSNVDEKVIVQGVADLLVENEDKRYIIDYKTTKSLNADLLVAKYRTQLLLYKICLEKAFKERIDEVFIYSFALSRLIKVF